VFIKGKLVFSLPGSTNAVHLYAAIDFAREDSFTLVSQLVQGRVGSATQQRHSNGGLRCCAKHGNHLQFPSQPEFQMMNWGRLTGACRAVCAGCFNSLLVPLTERVSTDAAKGSDSAQGGVVT